MAKHKAKTNKEAVAFNNLCHLSSGWYWWDQIQTQRCKEPGGKDRVQVCLFGGGWKEREQRRWRLEAEKLCEVVDLLLSESAAMQGEGGPLTLGDWEQGGRGGMRAPGAEEELPPPVTPGGTRSICGALLPERISLLLPAGPSLRSSGFCISPGGGEGRLKIVLRSRLAAAASPPAPHQGTASESKCPLGHQWGLFQIGGAISPRASAFSLLSTPQNRISSLISRLLRPTS